MNKSGLADSPLFIKSKKILEKNPRHHGIKPSCNQNTLCASIHNSIKEIGREASTYRLSSNEKDKIIQVIYELRKRKIQIKENEIIRISINFLFHDYDLNKDDSLLIKIKELKYWICFRPFY